jgi:hypothetical protein
VYRAAAAATERQTSWSKVLLQNRDVIIAYVVKKLHALLRQDDDDDDNDLPTTVQHKVKDQSRPRSLCSTKLKIKVGHVHCAA